MGQVNAQPVFEIQTLRLRAARSTTTWPDKLEQMLREYMKDYDFNHRCSKITTVGIVCKLKLC